MTVTRTVVPGEWYAVLGETVVVLLPPSAKARVSGLWETVDAGAGFDEVLDAVISGGLRELPGFVLVSSEGRDVRVVIRGAGEADLTTPSGQVSVSGSDGTTWVEQQVADVSRIQVSVADGTGAAYTVGPGLVRAASVEHPPVVLGVAAPVAVPAPPEPLPAPDPEPEPELLLPPLPEPSVALETAPLVAATPDPAPRILPPAPWATASEPEEEPAPAPQPSPTGVARLLFSSGQVVDVDRPVVVGRSPGVGRFGDADADDVRRVTVPSPHQEISSTHLEVRPGTGDDEGSAVVTDLGSTNGTVVAQPGASAIDLRPGVAVRLQPGAIIDVGEGVTIEVE